MARLLLLYDTDDRDFARDIADLLGTLSIEVAMIPRATDGGSTLQDKEERFFTGVEGALFLITPGSERHGKKYPSPSVADEMGQAKQRFKDEPWRVIYLVDSDCTIQAVDQRAYIGFVKDDHRSVVDAVRRLIEALKDAAILPRDLPPAPQKPPGIDIAAFAPKVPENLRKLCHLLASRPNGVMRYVDFIKAAGEAERNQADGNLAVQDVMKRGLVSYQAPAAVGQSALVFPTSLGWDLVRYERAQKKAEENRQRLVAALAGAGPVVWRDVLTKLEKKDAGSP